MEQHFCGQLDLGLERIFSLHLPPLRLVQFSLPDQRAIQHRIGDRDQRLPGPAVPPDQLDRSPTVLRSQGDRKLAAMPQCARPLISTNGRPIRCARSTPRSRCASASWIREDHSSAMRWTRRGRNRWPRAARRGCSCSRRPWGAPVARGAGAGAADRQPRLRAASSRRITRPSVRNGWTADRCAGTRRRAVRAAVLAGLCPATAGSAAPDPAC